MGDAAAQKELDEAPECPDEFAYLVEWAYRLYGRSGLSMAGAVPLSYQEIEAWSRLTDTPLETWEVEGLIILDGILRASDIKVKEEQEEQTAEEAEQKADELKHRWPTRSVGVVPLFQPEEE